MPQVQRHAASCKEKRKPGPVYVTRGAVRVKVYCVRNRDKVRYQLAYSLAGKRNRPSFGSLKEAEKAANDKALEIAQGRINPGGVTSADRDALSVATRLLAPLDVPLTVAVGEYVAAFKTLPEGCTLAGAVEKFATVYRDPIPRRTVSEVVEELLERKERRGRAKRTMETLRAHCRRFADAFKTEILSIRACDIQIWLDRNARAQRTYKNLRDSTINLFKFAQRRGYLARTLLTEAQLTEEPTVEAPPIGILSPEDFVRLLRGVPPNARLYAAIAGLSGIRAAELERLKWEHVQGDCIEVPAKNAKTGQRRVVPVCDALKAWLALGQQKRGPVFTCRSGEHIFRKHCRKLFPNWPNNALRHSYISYRVVIAENLAKVAMEAGNSPSVINSHYRQIRLPEPDGRLVTRQLAENWFNTVPSQRNS